MSYFLRELVPDDETVHAYPFPESKTADLYAEIIRRFHTVAQQDHPLRVPNSEPLDDNSCKRINVIPILINFSLYKISNSGTRCLRKSESGGSAFSICY